MKRYWKIVFQKLKKVIDIIKKIMYNIRVVRNKNFKKERGNDYGNNKNYKKREISKSIRVYPNRRKRVERVDWKGNRNFSKEE